MRPCDVTTAREAVELPRQSSTDKAYKLCITVMQGYVLLNAPDGRYSCTISTEDFQSIVDWWLTDQSAERAA